MTREFDESGEIKLPIELQLYRRANSLAKAFIMEATRVAQEATRSKDVVANVGFMIFLKDNLHKINLEGLGADALKFHSIGLERFDEDDSNRTMDNHDAVVVKVKLYQDGSPYVIDGDLLEPSNPLSIADRNDINKYSIVLSPEAPPVAIQFAQMDFLTTDGWEEAAKHYLSREDCEAIMASFELMEINRDSTISTADYIQVDAEE